MIRTCKDLCCRYYPDATRRHVHYWDYLGFKRCLICDFLLKMGDYPNEARCKCCSTIFRTRIKNQASKVRPPKEYVTSRKAGVNYYIDYHNIKCATCGKNTTYCNSNTKRPVWYKLDMDSYSCGRCQAKVYYKTRKDSLVAQGIIIPKTNSKYYYFTK